MRTEEQIQQEITQVDMEINTEKEFIRQLMIRLDEAVQEENNAD